MCVSMHARMEVKRPMLDIFSYHSPHYFLLNLELTAPARLAGQRASGICLSLLPSAHPVLWLQEYAAALSEGSELR